MTRDELVQRLERQVADAEAFGATARVADVLRATLDEVVQLEDIQSQPEPVSDAMISVSEAAKRTGMSKEWIYKAKDSLPWVHKYESGAVRINARKLEAWLKRRAA